jgi:hypothetical protein
MGVNATRNWTGTGTEGDERKQAKGSYQRGLEDDESKAKEEVSKGRQGVGLTISVVY